MPTVADRVAQTVVAEELVSRVEAIFHDDSYGYRPGRSALDAVGACRQRCWKTDWVIDLDIQKFFDSVSWDLMRQGGGGQHRSAVGGAVCAAVAARPGATARRHPAAAGPGHPARVSGLARAGEPVPALCVRRVDGAGVPEPSGSNAMSMTRSCTASASARPARCWPRCRTGWSRSGCSCIPTRPGSCTARTASGAAPIEHTSFTFLGYTFRPRGARAKDGSMFLSFAPAISKDALKKIGREVRSWRLHRRTGHILRRARTVDQSRSCGAGCSTTGPFYRSALYPAPDAHQRLPDALGPQEIPPVPGTTPAPAGVAAGHHAVPAVLRPLGLDHRRPRRLVIKVTRAV